MMMLLCCHNFMARRNQNEHHMFEVQRSSAFSFRWGRLKLDPYNGAAKVEINIQQIVLLHLRLAVGGTGKKAQQRRLRRRW